MLFSIINVTLIVKKYFLWNLQDEVEKMKIRWGKMSKRKKNLEKVIQQCQKTLDKIEEELAKPEPK